MSHARDRPGSGAGTQLDAVAKHLQGAARHFAQHDDQMTILGATINIDGTQSYLAQYRLVAQRLDKD